MNANTYKYIPRDFSTVKKQKLLFLDLTDKTPLSENKHGVVVDVNGTRFPKYKLDEKLAKPIYDYILDKYSDYIDDEDEDDKQKYMCVDNPCENVFSLPVIRSAYGYYKGYRSSEFFIDKFFTIELFKLVKELNLEEKYNFKLMGYFHANVLSCSLEFDNKSKQYEIVYDGWFPAEFAIPYVSACLTPYMDFKGMVDSCNKNKTIKSNRKNSGGKKKKNITKKCNKN
jgi:hypothetical protein